MFIQLLAKQCKNGYLFSEALNCISIRGSQEKSRVFPVLFVVIGKFMTSIQKLKNEKRGSSLVNPRRKNVDNVDNSVYK